MVCLNWWLSDKPLDLETELTLGFLDHLMMASPASPLKKILLESGLGNATVGGGIEDELLQPQFIIDIESGLGKCYCRKPAVLPSLSPSVLAGATLFPLVQAEPVAPAATASPPQLSPSAC
ncbi:hypothetical protein BT93_E1175 [Corymbia citriodora subsp. variegata]|nr:hypothetical protein BT93_E1175 [Corymbia citriodora subsp. variegata]